MADKTVDILLNLTTKAKTDSADDLLKKFTRLEAVAEKLREKLEKATSPKRIENLTNKLAGVNEQIKKIDESARKLALEKKLADAANSANQLRERMEKIAQIGQKVAATGAAILAPFALAGKAYVDKYKDTEIIASRIAAQQERITKSFEDVGRVVASEFLPEMEKIADIAEKIAKWVEANPGVAKAAVGLGATLAVAGSLAVAVSQIAGTVATVQGLLASAGILGGAGAGAAGAGAAGLTGSAAVPVVVTAFALGAGAMLGNAIGNAINRATGQGEQSLGDVGRSAQMASALLSPTGLAAQGLGAIGFKEQSAALWNFTKAVNGLGQEAQSATQAVNTAASSVQYYARMQAPGDVARAAQATAEANKKMSEEAQKMAQKISEAGEKFGQAREAIAKFESEITERFVERASERAKIEEGARIEAQRMAEDHARALRDIEKRRQQTVSEAAEQRDALAIDRANQRADEEKSAENERYKVETERRKKDLALQLRYFDAETANQRRQDEIKLAELQAAAQAELSIIQATEAYKMGIYQNTLAQLAQMSNIGSVIGLTGAQDTLPPLGGSGSQDSRANQTVNIQMRSGQTMAQVKREIKASQDGLMRNMTAALGGI